MTTKQYLAALKKLNLTKAGVDAQEALGYQQRQLQNFAAGAWPVPDVLAKLLTCLLSKRRSRRAS